MNKPFSDQVEMETVCESFPISLSHTFQQQPARSSLWAFKRLSLSKIYITFQLDVDAIQAQVTFKSLLSQ